MPFTFTPSPVNELYTQLVDSVLVPFLRENGYQDMARELLYGEPVWTATATLDDQDLSVLYEAVQKVKFHERFGAEHDFSLAKERLLNELKELRSKTIPS